MIVAGVPISLRELHRLVQGWLRMRFLKPAPSAQRARLNFLYFSYAPDFECLHLSMRTLKAGVPGDLLGRIVLAEDQKVPFSHQQLGALTALIPDLVVLPVRDFEWGSPKSTHAELQIFAAICSKLPEPDDLLVKVDSDVLFTPNAKWRRLLRSTAPAIGDGHYLKHRFAQGGLYMIRRRIVDTILSRVQLEEVERVAREIDSVGEDMAISQLLTNHGHPFFFTRMMLFPDEYGSLTGLNRWVRSEFLALHCHKDKSNMPTLARRFRLVEA